MRTDTRGILALAALAIMLLSAALPLAQAAHFAYYNHPIIDGRTAYGTFEKDPDTTPSTGLPDVFENLADRLTSTVAYADTTTSGTAGTAGTMVLDARWGETATDETTSFVPFNYYLNQNFATGEDRLWLYGTFWAWHGYWWDVDEDGIIDDEYKNFDGAMDATTQPHRASGTDEFVWRGSHTGEEATMKAYFFPLDSAHTGGCAPFMCDEEPIGWDGNCHLWGEGASDANCYSPEPDETYADRSAAEAGAGNQMFVVGNGGPAFFARPWLVTGLDVVTVVNGKAVQSPEKYDVACAASGPTCLRDYDHYEAMAGDDVSELYLNTMHISRDAIWTHEVVHPDLGPISLDRTYENAKTLDVDGVPEVSPTYDITIPEEVPVFGGDSISNHDTFHEDVDGRGNATDASGQKSTRRTWTDLSLFAVVPRADNADGSFEQYWCRAATDPVGDPAGVPVASQCASLTGHGSYGYLPGGANAAGTVGGGIIVHGDAEARAWDDLNGDGYVGAPSQSEIDFYNAGLDNSPNDYCQSGPDCEVSYHTTMYQGKLLRVWPCDQPVNGVCTEGAWPPGSFVSRVYNRPTGGAPLYPDGEWSWTEQSTPAFGGEPVDLRFDDSRCNGARYYCETRDGIFMTGGSTATLGGLHAVVGSGLTLDQFEDGRSPSFTEGATLTWTEGTTEFSITHHLTRSYTALPYENSIEEDL